MSKIFEWPCQRAKRASDRIVTKTEVGVAVIQRHAPRFKRHQQRPHLCVDSKHDNNNKQTALANSSTKVNASPTCARTPLSNCTNQHCSFKLFLGATCYSFALDAEAFVPVMVERERANGQSPMRNFVVEFNFKCLTPATTIRQCTVMVGCKLQIFHL
jgi:hypothetical protein